MPTFFTMYALVFFFSAVLLLQLSAFLAFAVPPRNWQQFAFYRRAYAGVAPWRLRIGLVGGIICVAVGVISGILAIILAVMNVLVPTGPITAQDFSYCVTLLLLAGAMSLLIHLSPNAPASPAFSPQDSVPHGPRG